MTRIFERLTRIYRSNGHYIKKKSEYTLFFITLMGVYGLLNAFIELWGAGSGIIIGVLCLICGLFSLLIFVLSKGKLVITQNIFLTIGLLIGFRYMVYNTHFQFYTQMIMILIIGVTIHIKKYQMYLVYSIVNGAVVIRAYFLYNLISAGFIDKSMLNQSLQAALGIGLFSIIIAYFNNILNSEIEESRELGQISITDALTHLPNRAKFNHRIRTLIDKKESYILSILDIDHFKTINDSMGHDKGDKVLIDIANIMRDYFALPYEIFRWGGEEFAVIVPSTSIEEAFMVLEGFRNEVKGFEFGLGHALTISGGVTSAGLNTTIDQVVIDADNALYDAKNQGRDQIIMSQVVMEHE